MPRGDRTGPQGLGPKTGRGFGPCNSDNQIPRTPNQPDGTGFSRGIGMGRRRGKGQGAGRGQGRGRRRQ